MLLSLALACSAPTPPAPPLEPLPHADSLNLARHPPAELSLPPHSRPQTVETIPCPADWERIKRKGGASEHRAALPVRVRALNTRAAPAGMEVLGPDGRPLTFDANTPAVPVVGTWRLTAAHLYLRLPNGVVPGCAMRYPAASVAEDALNLERSGLGEADFALRSVDLNSHVWTGLLLPAPGRAEWHVTVPEGGRLSLSATVLPPEVVDGASDGARLRVEVEAGGQTTEVAALPLATAAWGGAEADLSAWGGQAVRLRLISEPDADPTDEIEGDAALDYVFVSEPLLYRPSDEPRRIVMLFADTLRPDHLRLYGYGRRTSPRLDAWSKRGVVFTAARSVAPWTLPAARAVFSGNQPESWYEHPHLMERLAAAGWRTEGAFSNVNLSPAYDMGPGWSRFGYRALPSAVEVVDRGLEMLRENADRDLAMVLHFMDPHLPYEEPERWREIWAKGPGPLGVADDAKRPQIMRLAAAGEDREALRRWLVGRYDQNIRFMDDELQRLLQALTPRDTVVFFSDHGEEFWEHDGFEHGHALFDEVLRVPLIIQSPELPPGTVDAPVSLLDVAPTILEIAGLPTVGTAGRSLLPAARGEPGAEAPLNERPQGFGRLIYAPDTWGVLADGRKWVGQGEQQSLYDLDADPDELQDLAASEPIDRYPQVLGEALGREIRQVLRLNISGPAPDAALTLEVRHPAGFERTWFGYDARGHRARDAALDDSGALILSHTPGALLPQGIYLLPNDPDPLGLSLTLRAGEEISIAENGAVELASIRHGRTRFYLTLDEVPLPAGREVTASAEGQEEALRALGYIE